MRATIESTSRVIYLENKQVRIWEGVSDSGIKFYAFIKQISVKEDADKINFDKELFMSKELPAEVAFTLTL